MNEIAKKGYMIKSLGMSTKEVISKLSHDQALTITKNALKDLINQFFSSEDGRALLECISPDAVKFFTDKSFIDAEDHTKIEVQLASFFEEVTEHLPCILLIDSGCKFINPGINSLIKTEVIEGKLHSTYRIMREVELTIAVGSMDETTTNNLMSLLHFLLGDLRHIAGGEQIVSNNPQDEWSVTVPRNSDTEKASPQDIPGGATDQKDKMWRCSMTFGQPFVFEDSIRIAQDMSKEEIHSPLEEPGPIVIDFPNTLSVNEARKLIVRKWNPMEQRIVLDDYRVASINPDSGVITPRDIGTFEIRVITRFKTNNQLAPEILARKLVTVVA